MTTLKQPRITDANWYDCTCVFSCGEDPATRCSWHNVEWHVHPRGAGRYGDLFGPCPVHPDAPGDL